MINQIRSAFLDFGLLSTMLAEAETTFPINKPVGGEPFGHTQPGCTARNVQASEIRAVALL